MRILVIEDDPKVASFIVRGLHEAGYAVDHTTTGEEGCSLAFTSQYKAGVVDLMLPGIDGLSLIKHLRENRISFPLIVLSAKRAVEDRVECLQNGADDYLGKPFALTELLARLQALIRRTGGNAEARLLAAGDLFLDVFERRAERAGRSIDLQPREFALLEHLMRNKGKVVSKNYLLEQVWDCSFELQTNVVDVLVCRLRQKIDKDYSTKLIHTSRGIGYVLRDS